MAKGTWIALGVVGAILLVVLGVIGSAIGTYNSFVNEREAVDAQSKIVDVQYQTAFRLVPQVVALAQQYLQNETEVQTSVAALRSGLSKAENGSFSDKDAYSDQITATRSLIVAVVNENYPNLKGSELYRDSINTVINAENKIQMEKVRYNDRVQAYNAHRLQCCIPVFVANSFGFTQKEYIGYEGRPNTSEFPVGAQL